MNNCRTKYDPNEFIFEEDICRIKLYDKDCNEKEEAMIDIEDYEKVKGHKWSSLTTGYVKSTMLGKMLHHVILDFEFKDHNEQVDHINGNKLDNRKINLRICNHSQNKCNQGKLPNNTCGIKGIYKVRNSNRWRAVIRKNYKRYHLGYYGCREEAQLAYNKACHILHDEYANCN